MFRVMLHKLWDPKHFLSETLQWYIDFKGLEKILHVRIEAKRAVYPP